MLSKNKRENILLKRRRALDVKELQEKKPDVTGIIGESKEEEKYELKTAAQAAEQFRRGETSEERMAAIIFLRQMISCGEEEIAAAIDRFLETNLLPEIMTIIKLKTCDLQMLSEFISIMTNVASGTSAQTAALVNCGAIAILNFLLSCRREMPLADTKDVIWALGNIAGDQNADHRKMIIAEGTIHNLIAVGNEVVEAYAKLRGDTRLHLLSHLPMLLLLLPPFLPLPSLLPLLFLLYPSLLPLLFLLYPSLLPLLFLLYPSLLL